MNKLIVFAWMLCMTACVVNEVEPDLSKQTPPRAIINYYFSVKSSTEYDSLSLWFDYTRAYQGTAAIRTVYLEPKLINLSVKQNKLISLGSSSIEPGIIITGYDFGFSQFKVVRDKHTLTQFVPGYEENLAEADFVPDEGDTLDIHFELDLNASLVLDSAGKNWMTPKINILKEP